MLGDRKFSLASLGAQSTGPPSLYNGSVICSESKDSRKPSSFMEVSMTRISAGDLLPSQRPPPPTRVMNHSLRAGVGFPRS